LEAHKRSGDTMTDEKVDDELTEFEDRLLEKRFAEKYPGLKEKTLEAEENIVEALDRILENETAKLCEVLPESLREDSFEWETWRSWVAWTLAVAARAGYIRVLREEGLEVRDMWEEDESELGDGKEDSDE